jgi:hypothetical protein
LQVSDPSEVALTDAIRLSLQKYISNLDQREVAVATTGLLHYMDNKKYIYYCLLVFSMNITLHLKVVLYYIYRIKRDHLGFFVFVFVIGPQRPCDINICTIAYGSSLVAISSQGATSWQLTIGITYGSYQELWYLPATMEALNSCYHHYS